MRLSELARLKLSDIELPKRPSRDPEGMGTVYITRRGRTDSIPLNYKACLAVAAYLKTRPNVGYDTLFINKFNNPLGKRAVQKLVTKYLNEIGITDASVHTLMHTHATHHVAKGTNLKTVQETLGHASLTTAIYVSLSKKAQRKALQDNAL